MKSIVIFKLFLLWLAITSPDTLPASTDSSIFGIFTATSPCDAGSRPLLNIPKAVSCEQVKWELRLYHDPDTLAPTAYKLNYAYGLPKQGTNEIIQGGTKIERKGKWAIIRRIKTNSEAVVYQLDPEKPQESIYFQKMDDNLLHLLNRDEGLMLGNAGWSYTLNRVEGVERRTSQVSASSTSHVNATAPSISAPPDTIDSPIMRAFVGRSPCLEIARQINKAVDADCMKVKWGLTLYHDSNTHVPTKYKLNGSFYRERIREGRWTIIKGTKNNPDEIVYQLDPDGHQGPIFLLKADDDILFFLDREKNLMVGNGYFSYTLNKTNDVLKY